MSEEKSKRGKFLNSPPVQANSKKEIVAYLNKIVVSAQKDIDRIKKESP